jgi:hypothetical protein
MKKICIKCGVEKPITMFKTEKRGTRNVCIQCRNYHLGISSRGRKQWLKEGKQIPTNCQCCDKKSDELVYDHDHKTEMFRGWICQSCNQGLGLLGDDIQSLRRALNYLEISCHD